METLKKAVEAMGHAHAPYSHFNVGCAVETVTGEIFSGCNVENASYGATICAERVAISSAVAQGHKKFKSVVLISKNPEPITPCGVCRQFMAEFLDPECEIHCYGLDQKKLKKVKMRDLLPLAFTSSDITK